MARPRKAGLSYYPLDVDIFEDDKLFDVQNKYGPLGEVIYIRLLCIIYKNGYYYKFDSIDKLANMLIKSIGNKWARDKNAVKEVIPFLAECNLLSSELMQENVLTSRSIQRRYLEATGRRQQNIKEYWLLDDEKKNKNQVALESASKSGINVYNNAVSVYRNPENCNNNDPKVNKSKVKESKVVVTLPTLGGGAYNLTEDDVNELQQQYKNIDVSLSLKHISSYLEQHTEKQRTSYDSYIKLWLQTDDDKAIKAEIDRKRSAGMGGEPSYNLKEYENTSMFDD